MLSKLISGQPKKTPHFNNIYFLRRERMDLECNAHQEENPEEMVEHAKRGNNPCEANEMQEERQKMPLVRRSLSSNLKEIKERFHLLIDLLIQLVSHNASQMSKERRA